MKWTPLFIVTNCFHSSSDRAKIEELLSLDYNQECDALAGLNKSLKAGTVVFRSGDKADGMYLVRKGELVVYLDQGGKDVILAKISEGGMVGEMALFDQMPRSASVKASIDTEITLVSLDDFGKLMKQIPKWFVSLMSTLSGRLRTTNDRIKSLEATGKVAPAAPALVATKPFQTVLRQIHIMELIWHRDGTKDGKDWMVQRKIITEELIGVFSENPDKLDALIELLCKEGILNVKVDGYKNPTLSMPNRGSLRQCAAFLTLFTKDNPNLSSVPEPLMNILKMLVKLAAKAPYDHFTVTVEELMEEAKATTSHENWKNLVASFTTFGEAIKPVKTSTKTGLGLRVIKADLNSLVRNLNVINRLAEKNLNQ
jgi:CRP/FNR family transcriptional regulator, cyclic AMP receptor protein